MPANLERARGILAAFNTMNSHATAVRTSDLEEFSRQLARAIIKVAPRFERLKMMDREEVIARVEFEALTYLLARPELIPDPVRKLIEESLLLRRTRAR
jgi:hypothetical protein